MVKVSIVCIVGILLALQLKQHKPEYGFYIGWCVSLILVYYGVQSLTQMIGWIERAVSFLKDSDVYVGILLKVVGITYLCEYTRQICQDAGFHGIAGQVEILGKLFILISGIPVFMMVIEQIGSL